MAEKWREGAARTEAAEAKLAAVEDTCGKVFACLRFGDYSAANAVILARYPDFMRDKAQPATKEEVARIAELEQ